MEEFNKFTSDLNLDKPLETLDLNNSLAMLPTDRGDNDSENPRNQSQPVSKYASDQYINTPNWNLLEILSNI